jgi:hypothetical protein
MIGMELVAGRYGHHFIRNTFERWNEKVFRPLLLKKEVKKVVTRRGTGDRTLLMNLFFGKGNFVR